MKATIFLIFLLALLKVHAQTPASEERCGQVADIAFIIDSSRSIWIYDFERQLKFVQRLVEAFSVSPNTTHVAALTFSHFVKHEIYFSDEQNASAIVQKIGDIPHVKGDQTLTYDAIASMHTELFSPEHGARKDVPHICILLTDGFSADRDKTLKEASNAKADGITIIGIGIGEIDEEELKAVVTPPADKNLFVKSTFTELESTRFQTLVGYRACNVIETTPATITTTAEMTTTTESTSTAATTESISTAAVTESISTTASSEAPSSTTTEEVATTTYMTPKNIINIEPEELCQGKEADVVFVIDMSTSIWIQFFREQMVFVADLVDKFDIDSGKTQVGIVTFSDEAKVEFYLNGFKDKPSMTEAIKKIKPEGGITNTHLAIETMLNEMFSRKHGSRPGVAHICILITDGRSSKPDLTEQWAEDAHDSGVYVFSIGVGNMTDKAELEMLASKPVEDFAFEVNGYRALPKIKNILAYKTCELPSGDQPRCTDKIQADIIFGLHGIGGGDRAYVEEFIKSVGGAFNLETGNVRMGMIENCNSADIELGQFEDKQVFLEGVTESMSTRITPFLHRLRMSFGPPVSGEKRNRFAVLLVSGEIEDMSKVYSEVMRLKFNTRVIVVGVGKGVSTDQLTMLASYKDKFTPDNSHVFPVDDASELIDVVRKIHVRMCQEQ